MNTSFKPSEKFFAIVFFFIISTLFLSPAFLGKVDNPVDIRDIKIYPWRYYSVDKKLKEITLWEGKFPASQEVVNKEKKLHSYSLRIPSNDNLSLLFDLGSKDKKLPDELSKFRNTSFRLSFSLSQNPNEKVSLQIAFFNRITKDYFIPKFSFLKILDEKEGKHTSWHKVYMSIDDLFEKSSKITDLRNYTLVITFRNKLEKSPNLLFIKDLLITCESFSKIPKIKNIYVSDIIQGFIPYREHFSNSLKRGKLPFWSNYILTGTEFLAEPPIAYFHPLVFSSYLLFDHFTAHLFVTFLCLLLCGIGAYFLMRYWNFGFSASLLAGLVYMFHPFNTIWFSFEHLLLNSATLPFLLLTFEKSLIPRGLLNNYLLISTALLGLIFMSGHLQHIYYTVIFFFLFMLFRFVEGIISGKRNSLKCIFSFLFIFSIGIMFVAIVLVPFLPFLENSYRVEWGEDIIKTYSFSLKSLIYLINPYILGHKMWIPFSASNIDFSFVNNYVYFGLLPFLFSLLSLKLLFKNNLVVFLLLTIIVSFLVCTGSPFFFFIRDFVPGFKQLQHYRFLQVYSYCVPFLAGIGFQVLLNFLQPLKQGVGISIVALILVFTSVDLLYHSSYFLTWSDRKEYKPIQKGGSLEFLLKEKMKSSEPFRVLPIIAHRVNGINLNFDVAIGNTLQPYKLEDASGYSSFVHKDIYSLFTYTQTRDPNAIYPKELTQVFPNVSIPYPISNFKSKILDLLNVKYFLVPNILSLESMDIEKVYSGDIVIYKNRNYLPRAFVVPSYKVIKNPKKTIVYLDSEEFNPRKEVMLISKPQKHESSSAHSQSIPLKWDINFIKYESENITLKVKTNQGGYLVLGHNLNNNWKVKINKKEAKHMQANLVQRAVYLPEAGDYKVEFYYFPILFLIGAAITGSGFLILVFLAIYLNCFQRNN